MLCDCDFVVQGKEGLQPHYDNCTSTWSELNPGKERPKNPDGTMRLINPHLQELEVDILYHLGFDTKTFDLPAMFSDVKTYGIELSCSASNSAIEIQILQRLQNIALRTISKAHGFVRNKKIHDFLEMLTVREEVNNNSKKYKERLENHRNDLFVCMGGTKHRMREFAVYLAELLNLPSKGVRTNLTKHSQRYAMYKVGPVLSISHGVGIPSMTTLLLEVIKLMCYSKAKDPIFLRIGTCGGVGVPAGSVVVSSFGLNGTLERSYCLPVLGEIRKFPAKLDSRVCKEIHSLSSEEDGFKTFIGGTMAADDFYMGQARLDGPFCNYTEADKMQFLRSLCDLGVRNIEMEVTAFGAYTREAGIRAGVICVTFLDRLEGDQVTPSKVTMAEWQKRPMIVAGRYIKKYLEKK